jgi:transposase
MGYRRMKKRDLWEIYRRWQAGQSLSHIAVNERRDRKTVRYYLERFGNLGLAPSGTSMDDQQFYQVVQNLLPARNERPAPGSEQLLPHVNELRELINRSQEALKPKTAFLVVRTKYELSVSYATFKRFARQQGLSRVERKRMIRIELPPGLETQLDYGKVGTLQDAARGAARTVWAFCGVLTHSRLPYVQFVFSQDKGSFVGSVVLMLEYYGGATQFISPDNLKSAVIKPDLWDPQINRALAEAAEHYGVFVDPCRVARSTDKGKVERFVPVARELFGMLKALYPSADLGELNRRALQWCREDYGRREHGTTGVAPMEAFEVERSTLKALPAERFQAPEWKHVSVHAGDQFLTFNKSRFSLPPAWRGLRVWARYAAPLLQLYDNNEHLLRQYVLNDHQRIYWMAEDFPAEVRTMMNGGYPGWILEKGRGYGQAAVELLASVLQPHAYLNARRARGMLDVMATHHGRSYFEEVCQRAKSRSVVLPATLKRMMEAAARWPAFQHELPLSEFGAQMVRDVRYYTN